MFEYRTDICKHIRNYIRLNVYKSQNQDIEIAFKEYLDKNNFILINTKTLSIINSIKEAEDIREDEFKDNPYIDVYCGSKACLGETDIRCIPCFLDYKLDNNDFKLIERKDNHV